MEFIFSTRCPISPLAAALMFFALQPAIMAQVTEDDGDQDGVPDNQDICPSTPRGTVPIGSGCSAMEFVQKLDVAAGAVLLSLDELRVRLDKDIDMAQAVQPLIQ